MNLHTPPSNDVPPGMWVDAKGRYVPDRLVPEKDKLISQTVETMIGHAKDLSAQIGRFKGHCFADVAALLSLLGELYDTQRGGRKGNITLTHYSGLAKVQLSMQDRFTFGPELQIAKGLVDECLTTWSADSRDEIRAIIQDAFAVDQEGTVNREALMRLPRLAIDDPTWKKAMEALRDSIQVEGSKAYFRFYVRASIEHGWTAVPIDMAAIDVPEPPPPAAPAAVAA